VLNSRDRVRDQMRSRRGESCFLISTSSGEADDEIAPERSSRRVVVRIRAITSPTSRAPSFPSL